MAIQRLQDPKQMQNIWFSVFILMLWMMMSSVITAVRQDEVKTRLRSAVVSWTSLLWVEVEVLQDAVEEVLTFLRCHLEVYKFPSGA